MSKPDQVSEITVWVVGRYYGSDDNGITAWGFHGVFDSEDKALAECKGPDWFMGPACMNEALPGDIEVWPGCRYPRRN